VYPYFFPAGLSELAPLFWDVEEPLLFEVSVLLSDLLSDEEADADPLPLAELSFDEDFFA
jgi:hypothetical protein